MLFLSNAYTRNILNATWKALSIMRLSIMRPFAWSFHMSSTSQMILWIIHDRSRLKVIATKLYNLCDAIYLILRVFC